MQQSYTTNTACRICKGSDLIQFLDLGKQPLANAFLRNINLHSSEPMYPLRVFFCAACGLSQLIDIVDPNILFRDYVYFSSGMPRLSQHFRTYAKHVADHFMKQGDLALEIGSNDGILLREIKDFGMRILGVDPALNIAALANAQNIETIADFFSEQVAAQILAAHGPAQAIIGNNVVAHINDYHDLMRGVVNLLAPKGVFVFEAPYFVDMVENLTFDTIYHEHMSYLSLRPLIQLFAHYGMEIFDVQFFPVQGMSLRVYASHKGAYEILPSVCDSLAKEKALGLESINVYHTLAQRVARLKTDVINTLTNCKQQAKRIAGYGATAKGNTLLNYFGIGTNLLEYTTEELPSKIGLYTPGMHIPVIHIDEARKNPPDYYFMLAWNYKNVILGKETQFIKNGGKFIMPVGDIRMI